MKQVLYVLKASFVKHLGEMKYYKLNYSIGILMNFVLIFGILNVTVGGGEVPPVAFLKILIGFIVWYYATAIISRMSVLVVEETTLGTLEQILVTQSSLGLVLIVTIFMDILISTLWILIFIIFILPWFHFDLATLSSINWPLILLIVLLALISLTGVGFIFFGVSLLFKRIGAISALFQYILLFFTGIFLSTDKLPAILTWFSYILPLTWPLKNLQAVIVDGVSFQSLCTMNIWIILWLSTFIYTVFGLLIARKCYAIAISQGKLSYY